MALIFGQSFPWREENAFRLLVDGGEIFKAMLQCIESAKSQILLEMYLVESGVLMDRFIVALAEAVKRGVEVCLLFDDYGARGFIESDRQRIKQAGIKLVAYNPLRYGELRRNLLRDHRKLMVVDASTAFVGGMGLTDAFDTTVNPKSYWHDTAVQVRGPVVADWHVVFRTNWHYWTSESLPELSEKFSAPSLSSEAFADDISTDELHYDERFDQAGHVSGGRRFGAAGIQRSFLKRVRSAERHVWMMTAYFVPPRSLLRALKRAARRGVDVRLVTPGRITDHSWVRYAGHRYYYSLLRSGVRIFEYAPRFLHAKLLLCDDWVSLGSSNVDRWNLRWNLEANQEIEDSRFAARVRELFESDFADSEECLLETWQLRPRYRRILEWFWGKFVHLLERVSTYLKRNK